MLLIVSYIVKNLYHKKNVDKFQQPAVKFGIFVYKYLDATRMMVNNNK